LDIALSPFPSSAPDCADVHDTFDSRFYYRAQGGQSIVA
jgi:hypothetical protein